LKETIDHNVTISRRKVLIKLESAAKSKKFLNLFKTQASFSLSQMQSSINFHEKLRIPVFVLLGRKQEFPALDDAFFSSEREKGEKQDSKKSIFSRQTSL